jgi:hypothetical protein
MADEDGKSRGLRRFSLVGGLVAGVLLGVLFASVLAHAVPDWRSGLWGRLAGALIGRSTRIDVSSPAVVEKIRKLSRLETVIYSIDKIVEGERQSLLLPNFLAGEKLLLVAHGEVIAGVDLGELKDGDVSVNGDRVRVRLPKAAVFTTRVDNKRTRVYSRMTGLLVSADPNLETEVRQAAEQQIGEAAVADGILDKAGANARTSVTALLYELGFRSVVVE